MTLLPTFIKSGDFISEALEAFEKMHENFFTDFDLEIPKNIYPNYPVMNHYIEDEGINVFEIAACGLTKDDLDIQIKNNVLTVEKVENPNQKEGVRKYLHHGIAQRYFKIAYRLSDKLDVNKTDVKLDLGILRITIPCKEDQKPITKKLEIK